MSTDTTALVQAIISCSHRLKAVGRNMGATTSNGGAWGLMKSLQQQGPKTIPELARARPVSRQHIRLLAQSLTHYGWIEPVSNPEHKRSFLLQLTEAGRSALADMDDQIETTIGECLGDVSSDKLHEAIILLTRLADGLQGQLDPDPL
jgi:DNA-binding MarR family transcriptional regulator